MAVIEDQVTDGMRVTMSLAAAGSYDMLLTEEFRLSDPVTVLMGAVLYDMIVLGEVHTINATFGQEIGERALLRDAIFRALPVGLTEAVGVSVLHNAAQAVATIEMLGLTEVVLPAVGYTQTVAEGIRVAAAIAHFFGLDVNDALAMGEVAEPATFRGAQVIEGLGMQDAIEPRFLIRVQVRDDVHIKDEDLVRMTFSGQLADGIEITAAFIKSGAFSTWAMNTRSAAITEYRNYDFNSFGRMGNRYLGASEDGLFDLRGDTDDGEDIIAAIRGGYNQWAGAHLHSFKAAYLAVAGEGRFVVRLLTPDGRTYNYTVTAQNMVTTKVNMGKGLRARYFAFELISTGQDFALETLEFIPLVATRRI